MSGGSVNPNLISYIFRGVLFLKKLCIDEERGRDLATNGAWYLVPGIVTLSLMMGDFGGWLVVGGVGGTHL